jgi:hypothetical protein
VLDRADAEAGADSGELGEVAVGAKREVGRRSVDRAKVVRQKGTIELVAAVEDGLLPVSVAAVSCRRRRTRTSPSGREKAMQPVPRARSRKRRGRSASGLWPTSSARCLERRYGVILADPPWRFEPRSRDSGMDRAADNHYPTMDTDEIAAQPISDSRTPTAP